MGSSVVRFLECSFNVSRWNVHRCFRIRLQMCPMYVSSRYVQWNAGESTRCFLSVKCMGVGDDVFERNFFFHLRFILRVILGVLSIGILIFSIWPFLAHFSPLFTQKFCPTLIWTEWIVIANQISKSYLWKIGRSVFN